MISPHQHLDAEFFLAENGIWCRRFKQRELADTISSFFARTRFIQKQDYSGTPCLVWQGARDENGYGIISIAGERFLAHRVAYVMAFGETTDEMICHLCDHPPCVNPLHLEDGDATLNSGHRRKAGRLPTGPRSGRRKHPERFPTGEDCSYAKLKCADVMTIHRAYWTGEADSEDLAKKYGMTGTNIRAILFGRSWKKEFALAKTLYDMTPRHRENLGKKRWTFDAKIAREIQAEKAAGKRVADIVIERGLSLSTVYKALRMQVTEDGPWCVNDAADPGGSPS